MYTKELNELLKLVNRDTTSVVEDERPRESHTNGPHTPVIRDVALVSLYRQNKDYERES